MRGRAALLAALVGAAAACAPAATAPTPQTFAEGNPPLLSDWGMLRLSEAGLQPNTGVLAYGLETPLFSDYAQKLRTVWVPPGGVVTYAEGLPDYPLGTVLTKTFYYPTTEDGEGVLAAAAVDTPVIDPGAHRIVETRVLVRRQTGWEALVYLWNEEETQALLARTGASIELTLERPEGAAQAFTYRVPNVTQCAACHAPNATSRALQPIGPTGRNLNRVYPYPEGPGNQIAALQARGWLQEAPADLALAPRLVAWTDETASLEERARAYLDVNCAHCHNAVGPADTSGLMLEAGVAFGRAVGLCKLPVAAGPGTGNLRFDIVPGDPAASILVYRLHSEDGAVMMPEIGRSVTHREGVALLEAWIRGMEGTCS